MYLCSPDIILTCFLHVQKDASGFTVVVSLFKALQHFAEGNSHSKATTQP